MTPCTPGPVAKCSASATGHASGARCLSLQPSNLNDLRWRSGVPSISAAGRPQSASRHNSALRWQSLGPRSRGGRDSQLRQPRQLRFLDHLDLQHRQHDDRGGSSYGSETASSSGGANGVQHGSGADGYPDGGGAAALRFENSYGASGGTVGNSRADCDSFFRKLFPHFVDELSELPCALTEVCMHAQPLLMSCASQAWQCSSAFPFPVLFI